MATTRASFGAAPVPSAAPDVPDGTTRVAMLARISGTRNGAEWPPVGGEITLPAPEAADLIRNYLARPAPEPIERAAIAAERLERATTEHPTPLRRASGSRRAAKEHSR